MERAAETSVVPVQARIDALRATKTEHTSAKTARDGFHDVDDHGIIYWSEPIPFEVAPIREDGYCHGARCIGENFRPWLDLHAVCIHPMSALAGAWAAHIRWASWCPEDRPEHLADLHEPYHLQRNGITALDHMGSDTTIGLRNLR